MLKSTREKWRKSSLTLYHKSEEVGHVMRLERVGYRLVAILAGTLTYYSLGCFLNPKMCTR